jgi:hypothetical protein
MTQFKKTILGKILGGAAKVVLPVIGAVTGIGVIGGLVKGKGIVSGVVGAFKKVGGGIDKVAKGAADLVSGVTKQQRDLIKEQKEETRVDMQKLTAIEKLIKAGATVSQAAAKIGVPMESLTGLFGIPSTAESKEEAVITSESTTFAPNNKKLIMYAGIGLAALFLLPKLLKGRR